MPQKPQQIDLGVPDDLVSLNDLAQEMGTHLSTCWRWITRGVRCSDGRRRKLPAERVGGRMRVSAAAFRQWRDEVSGKANATTGRAKPKRSARAATRKLDEQVGGRR